jgi:glycosyltransferase involved in cell wall biosynthesis
MPAASHGQTAPIRVLQTGLHWLGTGAGGLDRVFFDMAQALPASGVDVRSLVVSPHDVAGLTGGRVQNFAPASAGVLGRLAGARRQIGALAHQHAFDVIAPHFAFHVATALDRLADRPMVVHFHGPWAEESALEGAGRMTSVAKRWLETLVYRRATNIIVLSQAFADLAIRNYGVAAEKIRIVPGAVALSRFDHGYSRDDARQRLGWPTDRPILLSVRRLAPRMGLDRLVTAMQTIVRAVPEVLLFVAGRGAMEAALRAQVQEAGLQDHVAFLGFVPDQDLALAYTAADLNVVPSIALEGFGLSAAEALAAGTPSLVTPVGGLPEVVSGLSQELVLASSDADAIASGIIAALRGDSPLPGPDACRAYALRNFDVARAASQTAAIYRQACGR